MKNKARMFIVCVILAVVPAGVCYAADEVPVLIAASATSYSEGSSPITCLLDPDCQGYWSPKSKDAGINEGIYLQFKSPVLISYIDVVVEGDVAGRVEIKPYLDGKTLTKTPQSYDDKEAKRIGVKPYTRLKDTVFVVAGDYDASVKLNYRAKSIFLKIEAGAMEKDPVLPKIKSIRIFNEDVYNSEQGKPIRILLPLMMKAAVSATSILQPEFAYNAAHLFDSQTDFAWSTDGKKNDGINEKVNVKFDEVQKIQGIIVWNGYQRSVTHFKANGRVKKMSVNGVDFEFKDKQGFQTIKLDKVVTGREFELVIKEIYPGMKYKDVLVSELRFVSPDDRIILPRLSFENLAVPEFMKGVVDRTFAAFIQNIDPCDNSSIRLRSNGTFVIYKSPESNGSAYTGDVAEGNWETTSDGGIRLFGKKYVTVLESESAGYLGYQGKMKIPAPKIFQSAMELKHFNDLSEAEKDKIIKFLAGDAWDSSSKILTSIINRDDGNSIGFNFEGDGFEEAILQFKSKLEKLDPIYIKSEVYTNLLLPYGVVRYCYEYW